MPHCVHPCLHALSRTATVQSQVLGKLNKNTKAIALAHRIGAIVSGVYYPYVLQVPGAGGKKHAITVCGVTCGSSHDEEGNTDETGQMQGIGACTTCAGAVHKRPINNPLDELAKAVPRAVSYAVENADGTESIREKGVLVYNYLTWLNLARKHAPKRRFGKLDKGKKERRWQSDAEWGVSVQSKLDKENREQCGSNSTHRPWPWCISFDLVAEDRHEETTAFKHSQGRTRHLAATELEEGWTPEEHEPAFPWETTDHWIRITITPRQYRILFSCVEHGAVSPMTGHNLHGYLASEYNLLASMVQHNGRRDAGEAILEKLFIKETGKPYLKQHVAMHETIRAFVAVANPWNTDTRVNLGTVLLCDAAVKDRWASLKDIASPVQQFQSHFAAEVACSMVHPFRYYTVCEDNETKFQLDFWDSASSEARKKFFRVHGCIVMQKAPAMSDLANDVKEDGLHRHNTALHLPFHVLWQKEKDDWYQESHFRPIWKLKNVPREQVCKKLRHDPVSEAYRQENSERPSHTGSHGEVSKSCSSFLKACKGFQPRPLILFSHTHCYLGGAVEGLGKRIQAVVEAGVMENLVEVHHAPNGHWTVVSPLGCNKEDLNLAHRAAFDALTKADEWTSVDGTIKKFDPTCHSDNLAMEIWLGRNLKVDMGLDEKHTAVPHSPGQQTQDLAPCPVLGRALIKALREKGLLVLKPLPKMIEDAFALLKIAAGTKKQDQRLEILSINAYEAAASFGLDLY